MKKRLSIFLTMLLVLSLVAVSAAAAIYAAGSGADITGTGTAEDPYLIYTAEGLKQFGSVSRDAHAKLMADIVLNDGTFDDDGNYTKGASGKDAEQWTPIDNNYAGVFDGNGHTIRGLYVVNKTNAGLFNKLFGTVKNLTVTGYVGSTDTAGGIASMGGTFENCVNQCRVIAKHGATVEAWAGGIVGYSGTVRNCVNMGRITSCSGYDVAYAGGLVGQGDATGCYNVGKVDGTSNRMALIGGITGHGNAENSYWLEGTAEKAVGSSDGVAANTKSDFADGTVLALLKGDSTDSPWTKCGYLEAAGMVVPMLKGQTADTFTIYTAEDLHLFRDAVNGGNTAINAKLMADIVLNDGTFDENGNYTKGASGKDAEAWEPIGWAKTNSDHAKYAGTFDGGGHSIKGLYVTGEREYAGLFGITNGAIIKNVTVDGYVSASGSNDRWYPCTGGIVGGANSTHIENCTNLSTVESNFAFDGNDNTASVGGIAGNLQDGSLSNCRNGGKVILKMHDSDTLSAGGIVGYLSGQASSCCNTGAVIVHSNNDAQIHSLRVGGIAGVNGTEALLTSCYNTGAVTVTGDFTVMRMSGVGGVVGVNNSTVSSCYNTGKVSCGNDNANVGSVVGTNIEFTVENCCWLTGTAKSDVGKNKDGGTTKNVVEKSKSDFTDGTVLALLQNGDPSSPWTMTGYLEDAKLRLPLLEWQVRNARKYDISVVNEDGEAVQITSLNRDDVLGDGKISFVYDDVNKKGILTLNGVNIVCNDIDDENPIKASGIENLEIVLNGKNKIEAEWVTGIMAKNLTFSGSGSIDISTEGNYNWPVDCTGTFTVNGGDVKISSVDYALCLDGALTVNGGTLELIASDDYGCAIDIGRSELNVVLGDDRIMITGTNPNGADAVVTDVSEEDTIKDARYVKIFNKYIPITYNPGEHGGESTSAQNKIYGTDMTLPGAVFTRKGYKQTGWAVADGGDKKYELGGVYSGNESLTLYPVWQVEQYDITYNLSGGTAAGNPDAYTVESDSFTLNTPKRDGYEFAGWSGTGLTGTDNMTVTVPKGSIGNREYTANWRDIQAPTVDGLENGKTYCGAVEFTATDNDGIASVTANGTALQAENGKYTLSPAQGTQTVVVKDNAGNSIEFTVTVNDGHSYDNDCDTDCNVCGKTRTITHKISFVEKVDATCEKTGKASHYKCSCCGKLFSDAAATKEITDPAKLVIAATGHTRGDEWKTSEIYHWHECTVCGERMDTSFHRAGEDATETTPQSCAVCGYVIKEALGHKHTFDRKDTDAKHLKSAATCKASAVYYYSCSCGENGTETFESGDKLAHSFKTEWSSDGSKHWHECSLCKDKKDEADHSFEWKTDKEAAVGVAGSKHEECTVCGYKKEAVSIDPIVPATTTTTTAPAQTTTGGTSEAPEKSGNAWAWIVVAVVVLGGAAVTIYFVTKKKNP